MGRAQQEGSEENDAGSLRHWGMPATWPFSEGSPGFNEAIDAPVCPTSTVHSPRRHGRKSSITNVPAPVASCLVLQLSKLYLSLSPPPV